MSKPLPIGGGFRPSGAADPVALNTRAVFPAKFRPALNTSDDARALKSYRAAPINLPICESMWRSFEKAVNSCLNAGLLTLVLVASACLRPLCAVNSGVTLRPGRSCVTAPTFTHQSGASNWYNPSLIKALRRQPLTASRSLFILFCRSAHQRARLI